MVDRSEINNAVTLRIRIVLTCPVLMTDSSAANRKKEDTPTV